jgi:hypothetical protein
MTKIPVNGGIMNHFKNTQNKRNEKRKMRITRV